MSSITHHDLSMIRRKYTFESEKLQVDYLTFNIKNSVNNVQKIARYFNNVYKFNCYYYDKKLGIKSKKPYNNLTKPSYTLEMVFVFNANPVNKSTVLIQFSGRNASQFYAILKNQEFNWQIFNLNYLTLGRLDINYVMSNQIIDESKLLSFIRRSADKFKSRYSNANSQIIGRTLALGTRTGDYFLRVYSPDNISLKFELEIKKYKAKQLTQFLINNCFVEFEHSIGESFLHYLKIALVFDTPYTDWFLRILRDTHKPMDNLISSYMNEKLIINSNEDKLFFYRTIQLLSFARTCQLKKEIKVNEEVLYTFAFSLTEFAKQIGLHPLNSYQRTKLLKFFFKLQGFPPIYRWFSNSEFRSSIAFPIIRVINQTSKHTKLMVHITVSKSFYDIRYPFYFPNHFYIFNNKYDFKLKFAIIQSISSQLSTRKILYIEDLVKGLNNKNKNELLENLIQQFQYLKNNKFIQNEVYLLQNGNKVIQANKLTKQLIKSTKQLIFYENIL